MIPLVNKDGGYSSSYSVSGRVQERVKGWVRLIFSDRNSRNLFLFLILNLSFAFVELFYGAWTNSLGLISDAFHMFFDCTGLLAGLIASVISKWRPDEKFSYGYVRAEVLAGFVNGLFLLFIAFFILSEAVERLIEPPEVKHERLFVVSVLGLLVNLVGIYAFQHGHAHGHGHDHGHGHGHDHGHGHGHDHGHGHGSHNHSHSHNHVHLEVHSHESHSNLGNAMNHPHFSNHHENVPSSESHIMKGVFLHILADTLGSVGVIISSVLMHLFGWMRADPICSIFIALLIAVSVFSLIKDSALILMQRQPKALDRILPQCYQKVMQLAGVYSIQEPHFWTLYSDFFIGTLKLEISKAADPKYIVDHTQMIFRSAGVKQLYIQLDYTLT